MNIHLLTLTCVACFSFGYCATDLIVKCVSKKDEPAKTNEYKLDLYLHPVLPPGFERLEREPEPMPYPTPRRPSGIPS